MLGRELVIEHTEELMRLTDRHIGFGWSADPGAQGEFKLP